MANYLKLVEEKEYDKNKKESKYKKAYRMTLNEDNFLYLPDKDGFVKFFKNVEHIKQNLKDFIFVSAKRISSNVKDIPDFETYNKEVLGGNRTALLDEELLKRLNECKRERADYEGKENDDFSYFLRTGEKR